MSWSRGARWLSLALQTSVEVVVPRGAAPVLGDLTTDRDQLRQDAQLQSHQRVQRHTPR